MNLAGLPAQISSGGTSFVTTEQAPIMDLEPIVVPLRIVQCAPIVMLQGKRYF
jgi:hypothetical protein